MISFLLYDLFFPHVDTLNTKENKYIKGWSYFVLTVYATDSLIGSLIDISDSLTDKVAINWLLISQQLNKINFKFVVLFFEMIPFFS